MGEAGQLSAAVAAGDRRRPRRLAAEAVVRVRCPERTGIQTGFLRDLSPGGMFLRIVDPEPPGRRLGFAIAVEPGRPELHGEGEVVWSRAAYEGPGRPPGMAIRFLKLEPAAYAALSGMLGMPLDVGGAGGGRRTPGEEVAGVEPEPPSPDLEVPAEGTSGPPTAPWLDRGAGRGAERPADGLGPPPPAGTELGAWQAAGTVDAAGPFAPNPGPDDDLDDGPASRADPAQPGGAEPPAAAPFAQRFPRLLPLAGAAAVAVGVGLAVWSSSADERRSAPTEERGGLASPSQPVPAEPGLGEAPEPADIAAPLPEAIAPASRVTDVRWEVGAGSTVVVVALDGAFDRERASWSHIGGEAPRAVVQLAGLARAEDGRRWQVDSPQVASIRTGYHARDGGGELHVVLDLAGPDVRIVDVVPSGSELLVYVAPE